MGRAAAWAVHLYTASGLVFAMLAAMETFAVHTDPRRVFVWLAVALVIDATDGTLARRFRVKAVLPAIDGRKIDDIVDYLTFTFIPLLLMVRMEWLPAPALLFVGPALLASVLGFANVGAKDEAGGFFLGFPSYWNFVAFYTGIFAAWFGVWPNAVIVLVCAATTVAPIRFLYPNLAPPRWRMVILGGAIVWGGMLVVMLPSYPAPPVWLAVVSLLYPLIYIAVSVVASRSRPGHDALPPTSS